METGYVYFIAYDNAEIRKYYPVIKIGSTFNLKNRIKHLSTASPIPLILAGLIESSMPQNIEARLHFRFNYWRLNGEWFRVDKDLLKELGFLDIKDDKINSLFDFGDELTEVELLRKQIQATQERLKFRDWQLDELLIHIKNNEDSKNYRYIYNKIWTPRDGKMVHY